MHSPVQEELQLLLQPEHVEDFEVFLHCPLQLVPQPVRAVVTEEIVQENVQEVVRVAVVEHVSLHVMTPVTIHVKLLVPVHVKHIVV